jgi:hypothetical protein
VSTPLQLENTSVHGAMGMLVGCSACAMSWHRQLKMPLHASQLWQVSAYEPGGSGPQQLPMSQLSGPPHALPQLPQCIGSLASWTSHPSFATALQSSKPGRHGPSTQLPAAHAGTALGSGGHTPPQVLQLSGSLRGSMHCTPPSHGISGRAQAAVQSPSTHAEPLGQTRPQLPQLLGSRSADTQPPSH